MLELVEAEQFQFVPVADTRVTPAGSAPLTITGCVVGPPEFWTRIVKLPFCPLMYSPLGILLIANDAGCVMKIVSVADGTSMVPPPPVSVGVWFSEGAVVFTATVTVMVEVLFAGSGLMLLHVMTPGPPPHVQFVPDAETMLNPAGIVSFTVTVFAGKVAPPEFVTEIVRTPFWPFMKFPV